MKETQTNISYVQVPSYIVDKPTSALAEEIASSHKAKDLMYIKFELMHANVNRNKDEFTTDELKTNYKTAVAKPINWEHTNEIIGHIFFKVNMFHLKVSLRRTLISIQTKWFVMV